MAMAKAKATMAKDMAVLSRQQERPDGQRNIIDRVPLNEALDQQLAELDESKIMHDAEIVRALRDAGAERRAALGAAANSEAAPEVNASRCAGPAYLNLRTRVLRV
jgi:hypothetical protein